MLRYFQTSMVRRYTNTFLYFIEQIIFYALKYIINELEFNPSGV